MAWGPGFGPLWHGLTAAPFTWVEAGRLAVAKYPLRRATLEGWQAEGVRLVVNLHHRHHPAHFHVQGLQVLHLPIPDGSAPDKALIQAFLEADAARPGGRGATLLHCAAGLGRSGCLAAIWWVQQGMPADEALQRLRRLRPGSVETAAQEAAILAWAESLKGQAAQAPTGDPGAP